MTHTPTSYQLIHDPSDIIKFATTFEVTNPNHCLIIQLLVRRKYHPQLSSASLDIKTEIIKGGPNFIRDFHLALWRLETPLGSYFDAIKPLPNGCLSIYARINPKDTTKALITAIPKCLAPLVSDQPIPNALTIYKHEIITTNAASDKKYYQLDIDTKDRDEISTINQLMKDNQINIIINIETNKGFHTVVTFDKPKTKSSNKYKILHDFQHSTSFTTTNINGQTVKGYILEIKKSDPNVIVPGTIHAGFPSRIISLDDWLQKKN